MSCSPQDALTLLHSRSTIGPKRLVEPAPAPEVLQAILEAATAAPDHGRLRPWRLVLVEQAQRARLAQAFDEALCERDPASTPAQREAAREKAYRAPVLLVAVACLGQGDAAWVAAGEGGVGTPVHDNERLLALGCALQNILLAAHAHGFGSGLTSGQAMQSHALRRLLGLAAHEHAVCCVNIGTVSKHKPGGERPGLADILSRL